MVEWSKQDTHAGGCINGKLYYAAKIAQVNGYAKLIGVRKEKHFDLADLLAMPLSKESGRTTIDRSLRYLRTP